MFVIILHNAKNLSEAITIAKQILKYNPNNHTSSIKNYTIVNIKK